MKQETHTEHGTVIYTKDDCIFCTKAKALMDSNNFEYIQVKVVPDTAENPYEINRSVFVALYPWVKTLPQIWINHRYIGGYDNLAQWVEETSGGFGEGKL